MIADPAVEAAAKAYEDADESGTWLDAHAAAIAAYVEHRAGAGWVSVRADDLGRAYSQGYWSDALRAALDGEAGK